MSTNIYILKLANGAYYVGKTADPDRRIQQHFDGGGSTWTRLHKPLKVEKIIRGASVFDEDRYVKEYMAKHGIDKVRGGSYVSVELDDVQEEALERELCGAADACNKCGSQGHFAASCRVQKRSNECFRCGREGHYSSDCYARKTVDGDDLSDDEDDSDEYDSDDD